MDSGRLLGLLSGSGEGDSEGEGEEGDSEFEAERSDVNSVWVCEHKSCSACKHDR